MPVITLSEVGSFVLGCSDWVRLCAAEGEQLKKPEIFLRALTKLHFKNRLNSRKATPLEALRELKIQL